MLAKSRLQKLIFLLIALTITVPANINFAMGTSQGPDSGELNYVVIGAFAHEKNAGRFVALAKEKSLNAAYDINVNRQLFYVYVYASPLLIDAKREFKKIRLMPEYYDVWIFTGSLGAAKINIEPVVHKATPEEAALGILPEEQRKESEQALGQQVAAADIGEEIEWIEPEENYYYLYLNTVNSKNLREVIGKIKVIDLERLKQIDEVKSHEMLKLKDPNNGSGRIKLATDIFGFREIQHEIRLDQPVNEETDQFVEVVGDSIIVNFELQRFTKGDVLVMYNVYFYIDAAIMKPESLYELNSLLDMLQENQDLKVRINGHTNGNSRGKIIALDPVSKNYFSLNHDQKESYGSAKKLSLQRAHTIQQWLIDQGISEGRMEVKGWGGKRMIYGKHDILAKKNVRVEIAITED
ncbi:MAG: OmpA family protein [Fulvivirga sp.]